MLALVNLTKIFGTKVLFQNLNHSIAEGDHVGLIGVNGAGKTSLLNIITGLDTCDSNGKIVTQKGTKIGYLPQEINPYPKSTVLEETLSGHKVLYPLLKAREAILEKMSTDFSEAIYEEYDKIENAYNLENGYALEGDADKLLKGLSFTKEDLDKNPTDFSGGWRMRMELAKVLINKPDILVLDEPTNHLDLPSLMFLEDYLINFKGTLLFVSHDQDLLDKLSRRILYMRNGKISEYEGNFSKFLERHALEQEQAQNQRQNLDKKIQTNQRFVDRFGAKASKAKQAKSKEKAISRLKSMQGSIEVEGHQKSSHISIHMKKQSGKNVVHIEDASFGYTHPLIKNLTFSVQRGQRIAIVGANGIGKSTFLKTIVNELPTLGGKIQIEENVEIGYFAQSQVSQLDLNASALENVFRSNSELSEGDVRHILGSMLFQGSDILKPVSVMSGGEKNRVGLSCLIAKKPNFLILDEPTNHLDMITQEKLGDALSNYKGTIFFVSHDRRFINRIATHTLGLRRDGKHLFSIGDLDEFFDNAKRIGFEL
jgi:ATP-binding cassette subfamily F protein 3